MSVRSATTYFLLLWSENIQLLFQRHTKRSCCATCEMFLILLIRCSQTTKTSADGYHINDGRTFLTLPRSCSRQLALTLFQFLSFSCGFLCDSTAQTNLPRHITVFRAIMFCVIKGPRSQRPNSNTLLLKLIHLHSYLVYLLARWLCSSRSPFL